jgi:predicted AlkP superfamily pyrophosphatase or phosphodiesterase
MQKTVVIDAVGLSKSLIGTHTPFLQSYLKTKSIASISPMLPAVTTSVQSTYLTGLWPSQHGIVGNGWYDRIDCEVKFWKQSNKLVSGEKIWEKAKRIDPGFTCSNMFWWYNMYSSVDFSVTPRPNYLADGRKIPDCYSFPPELRDELQRNLGQFPLFQFWGPGANIRSTAWIADASIHTDRKFDPTLTLIYLPHLDYCLQKFGPDLDRIGPDLTQLDEELKKLVEYYESRNASVIILSEYGITKVDQPLHLNRILRKEGLLGIRVERGLELLDPGASKAFAVADHQLAHIYVNDTSKYSRVRELMESTPGVALVLDKTQQEEYHIGHERSGDFVVMADERSWFTYYFWIDDEKAPDYARTVDIHKKPGYDPVEMFMSSKARAAYKLFRKKAGLRYVMDVIPLDANLIRGSHGRIGTPEIYHPVIICDAISQKRQYGPTEVADVIWRALTSS